jgi:hypothetical protein
MDAFTFTPAPSLPGLPDLRARLATQVDFLDQLSKHACDSAAQLSELNLRSARQLADDGFKLGRALAACPDPFQFGATALRETQPVAEHLHIWQSALMGVLTTSGAALAHDANDGGWQAARRASGNPADGAARHPT